jgi:ABC-type polar amino acid transport system ATPase subunit
MPLVEARNISKSYGDLQVLKQVSLQAQKGDVISLIGRSGSGKSTLLRCLNLLETPDSGEILFEGQAVQGSESKAIRLMRAQLGMIFQQFHLWSDLSVHRNLTLAPLKVLGLSKAEADERAEHYLNKVGLIDKMHSYPSQLSGGQQQRVAIARALMMEPKALLLDEPTSALDPELVREVANVIDMLAQDGRTLIMATHEIPFVLKISHRIHFLEKGQIAFSGSPADFHAEHELKSLRNFLFGQKI